MPKIHTNTKKILKVIWLVNILVMFSCPFSFFEKYNFIKKPTIAQKVPQEKKTDIISPRKIL